MTDKSSTRLMTALVALALLLVSACGSSGGSDGAKATTTPPTATTQAAAGDGAQAASGNAVTIKGFAFNPATLKVKVGTKVTWTNKDRATHTATSDKQGVFDTKSLKPGMSGSFTFDEPGTYKYHCAIHPTMTGEIVVS